MDERFFNWETRDDVLIIRFHGSLESHITDQIRRGIMAIIDEEGVRSVILNLEDTTYIDSMGLGMFVSLHVQNQSKVKFLFCGLQGNVRKAFGYVKLISFFDVRETEEDAMRELADDV